MKNHIKSFVYFFTIVSLGACSGVEAFLQQKLFNFNDDIIEIEEQIFTGEHITFDKSDFYVLKMIEKGEIEISINNRKSYADLPFKKYIPIGSSTDTTSFVSEETYLYLHEFGKKSLEKGTALKAPMKELGDFIFETLDTLFILDFNGILEASGGNNADINDFYNEKLLTLGKIRSGIVPADSVLSKYHLILEKMSQRIINLRDRQLSRMMRSGLKKLKESSISNEEIDFIQARIEEARTKLENIKILEKNEVTGIAAYFVTYPYTDSVNKRNLFNEHLNGNHLILNAVRHLRIGYWSKNGKDVTLYFKHKNKFVGFKGHHGNEDAFVITKGSHPSMAKHFSSKVLHFMDITEVLDLGELDGLPFFKIHPERRFTRFYEDFEELLNREEDFHDLVRSRSQVDTAFIEENGEIIDTIITMSMVGVPTSPEFASKYPNILGFQFGNEKKKDKYVPKLYFTGRRAGMENFAVITPDGKQVPSRKFYRYDGMLSILSKKEFEEIKAVNP